MKKDVILALFIGLTIGALIAILAVKLPVLIDRDEKEKITKKDDSILPSVAQKEIRLQIKEPKDESIQDNNFVNLSGSVNPQTAVVIESELESFVVESDKNGSFSASLKLVEGGNPIYFTSIDPSGNNETKIFNLYYTTEKL